VQRSANDKHRLEMIDVARGVAIVAMAIYHFAWDLEFFGYLEPGTTAVGGWRLFARSIASSFLFLVGVSLVLAHARGIRWQSFLKRLAQVGAAAAAISLATWIAVPGGFIFFGILHQIALASLLGLAFLRLPWWLVASVAVAVIAAPHYLRSEFFDHPALWWVGLSSVNPRSNDYVPLLPWFGAVLCGIAAARLGTSTGLFERLARSRPGGWSLPLQLAGRHGLAIYLIHQPVLIGGLWLFAQVAPAAQPPRDIQFTRACTAQCEQTHDADFCSRYCVCMVDALVAEDRFDEVFDGTPSPETDTRLQDMVSMCTVEASSADTGEDGQ